jgi:hypothetical protein
MQYRWSSATACCPIERSCRRMSAGHRCPCRYRGNKFDPSRQFLVARTLVGWELPGITQPLDQSIVPLITATDKSLFYFLSTHNHQNIKENINQVKKYTIPSTTGVKLAKWHAQWPHHDMFSPSIRF